MKLTSYLVFNSQAEEAANFYADVLGGKIDNLYRYESMPPTPENAGARRVQTNDSALLHRFPRRVYGHGRLVAAR